MFQVPEELRYKVPPDAPFHSSKADGNNGVFYMPHPHPLSKLMFKIIASDGGGWEHVSVSLPSRCPTWEEMCWIKDHFWGEEDVVVQLHPRKSEYVNNVRYCLHLWRMTGCEYITPPMWMVGIQAAGILR